MPTLKLKKEDILNIQYTFNNDIPQYLAKNPGAEINTRFSFLINYNADAFTPIIKATAEASKTKIPEYEIYENVRRALLESVADKDAAGKPIKTQNGYKISKEKAEFINAELAKINEQYKDAIAKRAEEEKEIDALLKEDIDVVVCQTSFANFPKWLNPWQLKILRPFALESDEQIMSLIAS
jgi:hypothetical protein